MTALRVFVGADPRQPLAYTVCASSIMRHAKLPVIVQPIGLYPDWLPGFTRRGLTSFTQARYLVPSLCDFEGVAIFMDGDIIVRGDVNELAAHGGDCAVSVAQHVARFEWPSVMVFNNAKCRALTHEYVNDQTTKPHMLDWSQPLGCLPPEWNHCVGYEPHREDAKLIHFTAGIPCWPETAGSPHAEKWQEEVKHAFGTVSWAALMGNSVHAKMVASGALAMKAAA
jgi:hypothetical protein